MISLSSVLAFFGCSKLEMRVPQALSESVAGIQSDDIAAKAFTSITDAHVEGSKYDDYVASLPRHWRVVYTTFWLDCEVNNGGFHQFFWNSDGRWNAETLEDLKEIGAEPFIRLYSEALKIYEAHDYAAEKSKSGNSWEGFTQAYKEKRMDELESIYYKEPKSLPSFLGEYLLRNKNTYFEAKK